MSFFYSTDDDDPKRAARRPMLAFILVTLAIGAGASIFTEPSIPTWYAALVHPSITPPNWVFAPVWTTLYIVMAVAAWRVWRVTHMRSIEMAAYAVQLVLNFGWSWIFFSLHRIGAALAEILTLDVVILVTAILFFRRDRIAGLLFLPYLAWTSFASLLTYEIWTLNP
jgi:tryptophan-rich sensory protein